MISDEFKKEYIQKIVDDESLCDDEIKDLLDCIVDKSIKFKINQYGGAIWEWCIVPLGKNVTFDSFHTLEEAKDVCEKLGLDYSYREPTS